MLDWHSKVSVKFISGLLIICFIHQDLVWAQGGFPVWSKPASSTASLKGPLTTADGGFTLPRDLALTKEAHKAAPADARTIITIQDAHASLAAQESIASILNSLASNYDLKMVAVEGSVGHIDTSVLRTFPDEKVRKETAHDLMARGKLSAGEFFTATSGREIALYGIEDAGLYTENLAQFRKIFETGTACTADADALIAALNRLKEKAYSDELKALDANGVLQQDGRLTFSERWQYLETLAGRHAVPVTPYENLARLAASMKIEPSVDFEKANRERDRLIDLLGKRLTKPELEQLVLKSLSFKQGKMAQGEYYGFLQEEASRYGVEPQPYANLIRFTEYISLYESIDLAAVFSEVAFFERDIKEKLFTTGEQRELDRLLTAARLLKGLFEVKLLGADIAYLADTLPHIDGATTAKFIRDASLKYRVTIDGRYDLGRLFTGARSALEFYATADKRNSAILANTVKRMSDEKVQVAALITGGYHTKGLTELLKSRETSYLVILPKFDASKPDRPYVTILTQRSEPYRDLLENGKYRLATQDYFSDNDINNPAKVRAFIEDIVFTSFSKAAKEGKSIAALKELWKESYRKEYVALKAKRGLGDLDLSGVAAPSPAASKPATGLVMDDLMLAATSQGPQNALTTPAQMDEAIDRIGAEFGATAKVTVAAPQPTLAAPPISAAVPVNDAAVETEKSHKRAEIIRLFTKQNLVTLLWKGGLPEINPGEVHGQSVRFVKSGYEIRFEGPSFGPSNRLVLIRWGGTGIKKSLKRLPEPLQTEGIRAMELAINSPDPTADVFVAWVKEHIANEEVANIDAAMKYLGGKAQRYILKRVKDRRDIIGEYNPRNTFVDSAVNGSDKAEYRGRKFVIDQLGKAGVAVADHEDIIDVLCDEARVTEQDFFKIVVVGATNCEEAHPGSLRRTFFDDVLTHNAEQRTKPYIYNNPHCPDSTEVVKEFSSISRMDMLDAILARLGGTPSARSTAPPGATGMLGRPDARKGAIATPLLFFEGAFAAGFIAAGALIIASTIGFTPLASIVMTYIAAAVTTLIYYPMMRRNLLREFEAVPRPTRVAIVFGLYLVLSISAGATISMFSSMIAAAYGQDILTTLSALYLLTIAHGIYFFARDKGVITDLARQEERRRLIDALGTAELKALIAAGRRLEDIVNDEEAAARARENAAVILAHFSDKDAVTALWTALSEARPEVGTKIREVYDEFGVWVIDLGVEDGFKFGPADIDMIREAVKGIPREKRMQKMRAVVRRSPAEEYRTGIDRSLALRLDGATHSLALYDMCLVDTMAIRHALGCVNMNDVMRERFFGAGLRRTEWLLKERYGARRFLKDGLRGAMNARLNVMSPDSTGYVIIIDGNDLIGILSADIGREYLNTTARFPVPLISDFLDSHTGRVTSQDRGSERGEGDEEAQSREKELEQWRAEIEHLPLTLKDRAARLKISERILSPGRVPPADIIIDFTSFTTSGEPYERVVAFYNRLKVGGALICQLTSPADVYPEHEKFILDFATKLGALVSIAGSSYSAEGRTSVLFRIEKTLDAYDAKLNAAKIKPSKRPVAPGLDIFEKDVRYIVPPKEGYLTAVPVTRKTKPAVTGDAFLAELVDGGGLYLTDEATRSPAAAGELAPPVKDPLVAVNASVICNFSDTMVTWESKTREAPHLEQLLSWVVAADKRAFRKPNGMEMSDEEWRAEQPKFLASCAIALERARRIDVNGSEERLRERVATWLEPFAGRLKREHLEAVAAKLEPTRIFGGVLNFVKHEYAAASLDLKIAIASTLPVELIELFIERVRRDEEFRRSGLSGRPGQTSPDRGGDAMVRRVTLSTIAYSDWDYHAAPHLEFNANGIFTGKLTGKPGSYALSTGAYPKEAIIIGDDKMAGRIPATAHFINVQRISYSKDGHIDGSKSPIEIVSALKAYVRSNRDKLATAGTGEYAAAVHFDKLESGIFSYLPSWAQYLWVSLVIGIEERMHEAADYALYGVKLAVWAVALKPAAFLLSRVTAEPAFSASRPEKPKSDVIIKRAYNNEHFELLYQTTSTSATIAIAPFLLKLALLLASLGLAMSFGMGVSRSQGWMDIALTAVSAMLAVPSGYLIFHDLMALPTMPSSDLRIFIPLVVSWWRGIPGRIADARASRDLSRLFVEPVQSQYFSAKKVKPRDPVQWPLDPAREELQKHFDSAEFGFTADHAWIGGTDAAPIRQWLSVPGRAATIIVEGVGGIKDIVFTVDERLRTACIARGLDITEIIRNAVTVSLKISERKQALMNLASDRKHPIVLTLLDRSQSFTKVRESFIGINTALFDPLVDRSGLSPDDARATERFLLALFISDGLEVISGEQDEKMLAGHDAHYYVFYTTVLGRNSASDMTAADNGCALLARWVTSSLFLEKAEQLRSSSSYGDIQHPAPPDLSDEATAAPLVGPITYVRNIFSPIPRFVSLSAATNPDHFNARAHGKHLVVTTRSRAGATTRICAAAQDLKPAKTSVRDAIDHNGRHVAMAVYEFDLPTERAATGAARYFTERDRNYRSVSSMPNFVKAGTFARLLTRPALLEKPADGANADSDVSARLIRAIGKVKRDVAGIVDAEPLDVRLEKSEAFVKSEFAFISLEEFFGANAENIVSQRHLHELIQKQVNILGENISAMKDELRKLNQGLKRSNTLITAGGVAASAKEAEVRRRPELMSRRDRVRADLDNLLTHRMVFEGVWRRFLHPEGPAAEPQLSVPGGGALKDKEPIVLFAEDLDPIQFQLLMERYNIQAIVTRDVSVTSHWVIYAKNEGIPIVVVDLPETADFFAEIDTVIAAQHPEDGKFDGKRLALVRADNTGTAEVVATPADVTIASFRNEALVSVAYEEFAKRELLTEPEQVTKPVGTEQTAEQAEKPAAQVKRCSRVPLGTAAIITPEGSPDRQFIALRANADDVASAAEANEYGAAGIGLVRTEYLFKDWSGAGFGAHAAEKMVTEAVKAYLAAFYGSADQAERKQVARAALREELRNYFLALARAGRGTVNIRMIDIAGDPAKRTLIHEAYEAHEDAGRRLPNGTAFFATEIGADILSVELEAVMEAYLEKEGRGLRILFPMVNNIDDVNTLIHNRDGTSFLEAARKNVAADLRPASGTLKKIHIGIMLETPEAVRNRADLIKEEDIDFYEIGTNDLSSYTAAEMLGLKGQLDREDPIYREYLSRLWPQPLKHILDIYTTIAEVNKDIQLRGSKNRRPEKRIMVCGEMGSWHDFEVFNVRKVASIVKAVLASVSQAEAARLNPSRLLPLRLSMSSRRIPDVNVFLRYIEPDDFSGVESFVDTKRAGPIDDRTNTVVTKVFQRIYQLERFRKLHGSIVHDYETRSDDQLRELLGKSSAASLAVLELLRRGQVAAAAKPAAPTLEVNPAVPAQIPSMSAVPAVPAAVTVTFKVLPLRGWHARPMTDFVKMLRRAGAGITRFDIIGIERAPGHEKQKDVDDKLPFDFLHEPFQMGWLPGLCAGTNDQFTFLFEGPAAVTLLAQMKKIEEPLDTRDTDRKEEYVFETVSEKITPLSAAPGTKPASLLGSWFWDSVVFAPVIEELARAVFAYVGGVWGLAVFAAIFIPLHIFVYRDFVTADVRLLERYGEHKPSRAMTALSIAGNAILTMLVPIVVSMPSFVIFDNYRPFTNDVNNLHYYGILVGFHAFVNLVIYAVNRMTGITVFTPASLKRAASAWKAPGEQDQFTAATRSLIITNEQAAREGVMNTTAAFQYLIVSIRRDPTETVRRMAKIPGALDAFQDVLHRLSDGPGATGTSVRWLTETRERQVLNILLKDHRGARQIYTLLSVHQVFATEIANAKPVVRRTAPGTTTGMLGSPASLGGDTPLWKFGISPVLEEAVRTLARTFNYKIFAGFDTFCLFNIAFVAAHYLVYKGRYKHPMAAALGTTLISVALSQFGLSWIAFGAGSYLAHLVVNSFTALANEDRGERTFAPASMLELLLGKLRGVPAAKTQLIVGVRPGTPNTIIRSLRQFAADRAGLEIDEVGYAAAVDASAFAREIELRGVNGYFIDESLIPAIIDEEAGDEIRQGLMSVAALRYLLNAAKREISIVDLDLALRKGRVIAVSEEAGRGLAALRKEVDIRTKLLSKAYSGVPLTRETYGKGFAVVTTETMARFNRNACANMATMAAGGIETYFGYGNTFTTKEDAKVFMLRAGYAGDFSDIRFIDIRGKTSQEVIDVITPELGSQRSVPVGICAAEGELRKPSGVDRLEGGVLLEVEKATAGSGEEFYDALNTDHKLLKVLGYANDNIWSPAYWSEDLKDIEGVKGLYRLPKPKAITQELAEYYTAVLLVNSAA